MRTSAFRYLFFAFLMLLTDVTFGAADWTSDVVGAAALMFGLREVCVFDGECATEFAKARPWAWVCLVLDAVRSVLYFLPFGSGLLPWLHAAVLLISAVPAWICGAGVFRMAVQAGQHSLAGSLRKSIFMTCICCVSVSCSITLSAMFGQEASLFSSLTLTVVSLCSAVWFCVQLLRAQRLLRPFFG